MFSTSVPKKREDNKFKLSRLLTTCFKILSLHDLITWSTSAKHENSSLLKDLKLANLRIFSRISQISDCNGRQKLEAFVWLKQLLLSSHACMVFHTNPRNFEIFNSVMKYFLKHYMAQISFYFIKAIWAVKCVKEKFNDSLIILDFTMIVWKSMQTWLGGKSCFSHTNASNFWRPLQSLLLRYTTENSQVT